MSKCIVAGTFDPLTLGHENIIKRAQRLFDEVVVAILVNPDKKPKFSEENRMDMVYSVFGDDVRIISYKGMAVDLARNLDANCFVRGVRSDADLAYELEMADYNKTHGGFDTVLLPAESDLTEVNATIVRELIDKKEDLSKYLSKNVINIINGGTHGRY